MASSVNRFREVVRQKMLEEFDKFLKGYCTESNVEADDVHHFSPRTCMPNNNAHQDSYTTLPTNKGGIQLFLRQEVGRERWYFH